MWPTLPCTAKGSPFASRISMHVSRIQRMPRPSSCTRYTSSSEMTQESPAQTVHDARSILLYHSLEPGSGARLQPLLWGRLPGARDPRAHIAQLLVVGVHRIYDHRQRFDQVAIARLCLLCSVLGANPALRLHTQRDQRSPDGKRRPPRRATRTGTAHVFEANDAHRFAACQDGDVERAPTSFREVLSELARTRVVQGIGHGHRFSAAQRPRSRSASPRRIGTRDPSGLLEPHRQQDPTLRFLPCASIIQTLMRLMPRV